jgi:predicted glutamine amidotransferase
MCRHIGYIGRKNSLYSILLEHKHSLIKLAYKPKEMNEAILNADGFGIGWLKNNSLGLYKNDLPIWNDLNLNYIANSISSELVIGNVRSATVSDNLGFVNTHPFQFDNLLFSHNGFISNFTDETRYILKSYIGASYKNKIKGRTDSELIFFLILQFLNKTNDIKKSIEKSIAIIKENSESSMLNFLIATYDTKGNKKLYATKVGFNIKPPSLYYNCNKEKGYLISSEKLNNSNWRTIKNNSLIEVINNSFTIHSLL